MSLNSDYAFKFGCGRYIQDENAIGKFLGAEAERAGTRAFVLCGNNGYTAAHEKIGRALDEAAFPYQYRMSTAPAVRKMQTSWRRRSGRADSIW